MTEKEINTKTAMVCCIKWMEKYNKICSNKEKQLNILESIKELKFMSFDIIQKSINILKESILLELELQVSKEINTDKNKLMPYLF